MTTIEQAIRLGVKGILNVTHTVFPGVIISYDYTTQKAIVQPSLRKVYQTKDAQGNPLVQDMPILNNLPVVFPRAGGSSISFPINAGDRVLVMCAERSLDQWILSNDDQVTPQDPRQFHLSDAFCLPGLYPFSDPLPLENNDDFVISHSGATMTIRPNGDIIIEGAGKIAIAGTGLLGTKELLDELVTLLNSFTALSGSAPYPAVAAAGLLAKNNIDSIRATL